MLDHLNIVQRAKTKLATPLIRRLLGRRSMFDVREELARRYLKGEGVEIGGLNGSVKIPAGSKVKYADLKPLDDLKACYPDISFIQQPDIITDLESLDGIADASLDFFIANHVLEHVENPLRALHSISRVLRTGGVAFIALPDKRYTFDKQRAVTPLAHLIRDFESGPEWSINAHYLDWAENVEGLRGKEAIERASILLSARDNIHFHVWDFSAMKEMFSYVQGMTDLTIRHSRQNRVECVWIISRL
jgi:SAM-dependent methyltransferase